MIPVTKQRLEKGQPVHFRPCDPLVDAAKSHWWNEATTKSADCHPPLRSEVIPRNMNVAEQVAAQTQPGRSPRIRKNCYEVPLKSNLTLVYTKTPDKKVFICNLQIGVNHPEMAIYLWWNSSLNFKPIGLTLGNPHKNHNWIPLQNPFCQSCAVSLSSGPWFFHHSHRKFGKRTADIVDATTGRS